MRYVFPPGRDVLVGRDGRCDIRLDELDNSKWTSRIHLVLRFTGSRWVAIDSSLNGSYLDGIRVSTVDIHDGLTVTLGDPRDGPRLLFRLGDPAGAPAQPPARPPGGAGLTTALPPGGGPVQPDRPGLETQEPTTEPLRWATPLRFSRPKNLAAAPPAQRPAQPPPPAARPRRPEEPTTRPMRRPGPPTTEPLPRPDAVADETATSRPCPAVTASGAPEPPVTAAPGPAGLNADRLGLVVDGHQMLADISLRARPGTLTAVIGPSRARNTALINLLAGAQPATSGEVTLDGHNVRVPSVRSRIGMVPRGDLVHRQLTVEQALAYAAELRLPPDTSADDRRRAVDHVLGEVELGPHRASRGGKLSADQRRRASVAVELLTAPSLLVLDEPITGPDPEPGRGMMAMLRRLADTGRVVVAVTATPSDPTLCDQVVLLTSAGTLAYAGPPAGIPEAMGTTNWADIMARLRSDPHGTHQAFLSRRPAPIPGVPSPGSPLPPPPTHPGPGRQIILVARRQARLLTAGHVRLLFLALLPFVLGALAFALPGGTGLSQADPYGSNPHEASEILVLLNIAAVIIGTALTIYDPVGERWIFRREEAAGLSPFAYLAGKVIVFVGAAAVEAAVVTAIVVLGKGPPRHGAVVLGNAVVELYAAVAATAIVSALMGLALSALAASTQHIPPMLVLVILASLVFDGGLVPLVGQPGFDQISWLVPARWGFAASAATVDLRRADPLVPHDQLWTHYWGWWLFDMAVLFAWGVVCLGFLLWRLLPPDDRHTLATAARPVSAGDRTLPHPEPAQTDATG
ncbi:MAG: ATP-binding cassette domain-containing protein [Mycobacterium sp.]|uniref:ATP-binding cassette domain-containing protein n=1 Tax=Mycobacterium sp. TaxID=1785 RepID=UPI00261FC6FA|nr:ATP-binding cassette domain-containing protein [Mycobacterium sp.]MDI3314061.1 ATP-binding cassette domain-containing protein [Mycobacterium sp.]